MQTTKTTVSYIPFQNCDEVTGGMQSIPNCKEPEKFSEVSLTERYNLSEGFGENDFSSFIRCMMIGRLGSFRKSFGKTIPCSFP